MASSSSRYYTGAGGAPTPAPTPSSPPPAAPGAGGGAFPFSSPGGMVPSSPAGAAAIAAASHFQQRQGSPADHQQQHHQQQQFNRPRRKRRRRRSTLSDGSRPGFGGMVAGLHPRVPHTLDLTYVTDRIIGMSAPATTRVEEQDDGQPTAMAAAGGPIPAPRAVPQSPAAAGSVRPVPQSPPNATMRVPQSPAEKGAVEPPPQPQPQPQPRRPVPQSPAVADANNAPSDPAGGSAGEPPPRQPPRKTSSLAAALAAASGSGSGSGPGSAADAAAGPTEGPGPPPGSPKPEPQPRQSESQQESPRKSPPREEPSSDSTAAASATALTSASSTSADARSPGSGPVPHERPTPRRRQWQSPGISITAAAQRPHGNRCDELKRFLARNHDPGGGGGGGESAAGNFLAVNISDERIRPTDDAFDAFGGQVINVGWVSPARGRGCQNPSVVHLSRICYAMHAFLSLGGRAGDGGSVYHRGRIKGKRGDGMGHHRGGGGFGLGLLGEFLDGGATTSAGCSSPGGPLRVTPSSSFDDFAPSSSSTAPGGGGGVVAVYCSNGKTRTGIVIACYLKYSGAVPSTLAGFHLFCRRRGCIPSNVPVSEYVPPSLRQFFANFDDVVELGGFANPEPLYLRAITVQGLPVDDAPAVDVWDITGGHVYSSHPISGTAADGDDDRDTNDDDVRRGGDDGAVVSVATAGGRGQWADEEGFYRVDAILHGDFALTCRFGGRYASDVTDPRKILFRYVNHTGCVCRGPLELPTIKVDVMRRYADDIDEDDFLVCLMFDPVPPPDDGSTGGDGTGDGEARVAGSGRKRRRLPPILDGAEAVAMGWTLIAGTHAVSTTTGKGLLDDSSEDDPPLARLRRLVGSDRPDGAAAGGAADGGGESDFVVPEEACVVALKLTNLNVVRARDELFHGRLRPLWDFGGGGVDDDGDGGSPATAADFFDRGVLSASNSLVTPAKRRRRALADSLSSEDGSRSAIIPTVDGDGDGRGVDGGDDNVVVDGAGKLDLDLARLPLPAALLADLGGADDAVAEASSAETARMRKVLDGIDLGDGGGGVMGPPVVPLVAGPGGGCRDGAGSPVLPCADADANAEANAASVVGSVLYSPIVPPTRSDVLDAFAASDAGGRQQHVHHHHRMPFLGRVLGSPKGAAGGAHSLALALPGDDDPRDLPLLPLTRGDDGVASSSWSPASSAGRRRRRISAAGDSVVRTFQGVTRGLFRSPSHRKCESHDFADDLHDAASLKRRRRRGDYDGEVDDDLDDGDGVLHSLVEGGDPSTVDMLMELSHTGVTVQDLASLARESFTDDDIGKLSLSGSDDDLDVAAIIQEKESEKRRGGDVSMAKEEGLANDDAVSEGEDGDDTLSDRGSGPARPSDEEPCEVGTAVGVENDEQEGSQAQKPSAATTRSSSSSLSKALASEKAKSPKPPGQVKRANFSKSSSLGRALAASQGKISSDTDGTHNASSLVRSASSAATKPVAATNGDVENKVHQAPPSSLAKAAAASAATFRRRGDDGTDGSRESVDESVGMSDAIAAAAAAEAAVEAAVAASAERLERQDDGDAEKAITTRRGEGVGVSAAKAAEAAEEAVAAVAERLGPKGDGSDKTTAKSREDVGMSAARAAAAAAIERRRGPTEAAGDTAPTSIEDSGSFSVARAAAAAAIAKRQGKDGEETSLCQPMAADAADSDVMTREQNSERMDDSMPSEIVGKEGQDDGITAVLSATTHEVTEHAVKEEPKDNESSKSEKLDGFSAAKAAAAAALSKRQGMRATSGDLMTSKADDVGMSAANAAAAAAIAKRQGVSDEKSIATLDSPASGKFSAAKAAAAAAMARRQGVGGVKKPVEEEAPNGLSAAKAAAAAAMSRRQGGSGTQESTQPIQPAGISAAKAAAAAALAKRQGGADDKDSSGPSTSPGGLNAAKAAAAAAMAKRHGQGDGDDKGSVKPTVPVAMSAAKAAAAAALARRQGNVDDDEATKRRASGGLTAAKAAAAAALAKRQGQVDTGDKKASKPTAPVAMSAAKAAAAAALARRQGSADDEVCSEAGSSNGISAAKAAAAAALARRQGQIDAGEEETVKPTAPVPMSAAKAAAAAALARRQGNADDDESTEPGASDGISAAKAAAAAAMAKRHRQEETRGTKSSTPTASVGMSAAKAAAAAALAKKQGGGDGTATELPSSNGMSAAEAAAAAAMARRLGPPGPDSTDPSESPGSLSGMSAAKAAAAAAMLKRDGKAIEDSEPTEAPGISAARAAAAAAMAKRQGEPNELKKKPNVVGMSAAKAAAAAAMAKREAQVGDPASEPTQTPGENLQDGCKTTEQMASGNERPALKDDPEYEKYFKMLKVGLPMGAVQNALIRDGKDPAVMDGDHSKPAPLLVSLKEDPEYAKYFKMLKVGLPVGAAKNALVRDGKNPAIMDLDPDKPLRLQQLPDDDDDDGEDDDEEEEAEGGEEEEGVHVVQDGTSSAEIAVPLKQDPEYEKYFRMLKMGLPMGAVQNALVRDGKDPSIMDLDPEKSLASQVKSNDDKDGPPLKEDPEYEKYFRMLKMGLPMGAVQNALVRDGKDPSIMELDPDKSLASQTKSDDVDDGPPLKEDPDYQKYFKMLKMGLPMGAVQNALVRDGKDPGIMDLDPEKSLASQMAPDADDVDDGPPLKEDPDYEKYFKMLKMGLPMGAVQNALVRDGKDPGIMDLDPDKSLSSQLKPEVANVDDGPPLKEDPDFEKYFKMLKMGLPMGAVQNALVRDGKDPGIMDLDPEKSLASQMQSNEVDNGPPLKEDPDYEKYFKMLKMGLPMGAVKNALIRDGKDPGIMDLDPDKSLSSNMTTKSVAKKDEKKSRKKKSVSKEKKKKVRRKKIFWTSIDESKIDKESIWSLVQGTVPMEKLKYDTAEFENLFTETATASDKKKTEKKGSKEAKPKKSVQVIDGKRGMNGGIILARLKLDFSDLAKSVDMMDARNLDVTQLKALQEFLPTDEEAGGLRSYLRNASKSEEAKQAAMHDLCACEKYMVAMMDVKDAKAKFDCMLFKAQFETRRAELIDDIKTVIAACDDLRGSIRLRKLMAMILALGNQINTGGTGNVAAGFTLDALLKLNEAKAFDKKTSVLLYLVKLVKQNDEDLLTFKDDISSTEAAERIMLDAISADMKQLKEELQHVNEAAQVDGDKRRLEEATIQRKLSMEELKEQKTFTRNVEGVTHFNRMVNEDDMTQMERFGREAEKKMDEAFSLELEMKEKYTKLLKYFGEDEKMASSDFFGTICRFISEFDAAYEQLKKLDLAKAKEEKRRKREEERRAAKQAKEEKKTAASKKPEEDVQAKEAREAAKKAEEVVLMLGSICSGNFPTEEKTNEATVDEVSPSKKAPGKGDISSVAAQAASAKKKETDDQRSQSGEDTSPSRELSAAKAAAAAAMARRLGPHGSEDQKATESSNLGGFSAAKAAAAAAMSNRMGKGDAVVEKSPAVLDSAGGIASIAANAALARNREEEEKVDENRFEMEKPAMAGTGSSAASAVREMRGNEENGEDVSVDMTVTEGGNLACRQGSVAGEIGDKESFVDIKGIASIALSKSKKTCGPDASTRQEGISESTITPDDAIVEGNDGKRIALSSRAGASRDTAGLSASSLQPSIGLLNEIENRGKARHDQLTPQDPYAPETTSVTQIGAHSGCADSSTNTTASEGDLTESVRELSPPTKPVANAALDGIADGICGEIGTGLKLDGDHADDVGAGGTKPKPEIKGDGEHCPQPEDIPDQELKNMDIVVVDEKRPPDENDRAVNEPTQSPSSGTHSQAENGKKPKENDVTAAQRGGIASAATAATVEKSQQPRENIPPPASDGIAAAAAAAALKKSKHPKESSPPPSSGGIAAAAAAAALKKGKQSEEITPSPSSGGIGAAAAAAAAKKNKQPKESKTPAAPGGIAAAAAAAALKKGKQPEESTPSPSSGGIAAAAAAAAVKKNKQPKESKTPAAPGGIAAAAAAAALNRGKQPEESSPSPSSGGIAAAAAAAAVKKNKQPKESKTPAAPGGIAAAAAAAALKRGKQPEESSPSPSSGGIAAAAAAAALKKNKQPRESNPSAARGGIAAAAAAAALARTTKPEDSVSAALAKRNSVNVTAIPVGGIAAAAAEAALKRRVDKHCHTY